MQHLLKPIKLCLLLFLPISIFAQSAAQLLIQARADSYAGLYETALTRINAAEAQISQQAGNERQRLEAFVLKGRAMHKLLRMKESQEAIDRALALATHFSNCDTLVWEAFIQKALILAGKNMHQRAAQILNAFKDKACAPPQCYALAEYYEFWGSYYGTARRFELAQQNFLKSQEVREHYIQSYPLQTFYPFGLLGIAASELGNYEEAKKQLEEAKKRLDTWNGTPRQYAFVYYNLGVLYSYWSDEDSAIRYFEEEKKVLGKIYEQEPGYIVDINSGIANSLEKKGKLSEALPFLELAIKCMEQNPDAPLLNMTKSSVLMAYGRMLSKMKAFSKADSLIKQAIELQTSQLDSVPGMLTRIILSYDALALMSYYQEDYSKAKRIYDSLFVFAKQHSANEDYYLLQALNNYAIVLNQLGQTETAIRTYNHILKLSQAWNDQPFEEWIDPASTSYVLWNKAYAFEYLYKKNQTRIYLDSAYYCYDRYVQFLDFLRSSFREEGSKTGLASENHVAYATAIELALQRDPAQSVATQAKIFEYMEKSRSLELLEAINQSASSQALVPPAILARENWLRSKIKAAEAAQINYQVRPFAYTAEEKIKLERELFEAKNRFHSFRDTLKTRFPDYFNARYEAKVISLAETQSMLKPEQTLLEFFSANRNFYIAVVQKNKVHIQRIPRDFNAVRWVFKLMDGLDGYHSEENKTDSLYGQTLKLYYNAADSLYQKLLQPIQSYLSKELIIVPDGILGYVPFEALLKAPPARIDRITSRNMYLIKEHQVSYNYSASLWREMNQRNHDRSSNTSTLLGMAPFFGSNTISQSREKKLPDSNQTALNPLPYSGVEVDSIGKEIRGRIYKGEEASKSNFLNEVEHYRILHLATHAKANEKAGDQSFIAFAPDSKSDHFMFVREIYGLKLKTELVVLSACETGLGEFNRGEGIISLGRAFAYAGAKSIVTSLWSVNDQKTAQLMLLFYKNLKKGMRKDEALGEAKRAFIQQFSGAEGHPFFWAGFIALGDMRKVF